MPPDAEGGPPGLKLRARDEQDLQVLAACLQDALVPLADMLYEPSLGRFAMVVNRFMWETPAAPGERGAPFHARVHGVLAVHEVTGVKVRDIDRTNPDVPLSLLTLRLEDGGVHLEFAGGGTIRIAISDIHLYLEDVGEPWPTAWRPEHPAD